MSWGFGNDFDIASCSIKITPKYLYWHIRRALLNTCTAQTFKTSFTTSCSWSRCCLCSSNRSLFLASSARRCDTWRPAWGKKDDSGHLNTHLTKLCIKPFSPISLIVKDQRCHNLRHGSRIITLRKRRLKIQIMRASRIYRGSQTTIKRILNVWTLLNC